MALNLGADDIRLYIILATRVRRRQRNQQAVAVLVPSTDLTKQALETSASTTSFLWRERGDDLFEAWVAAERVVPGQQLQSAVTEEAGYLRRLFQILEGEVFLTH